MDRKVTVYYSAGKASNVGRDEKVSDLTDPSWQIQIDGSAKSAEVRRAISSLFDSQPQFAFWDPIEEDLFQFGDATGRIVSSSHWFSFYLDRSAVQMLLAAIADGGSVAPNAAGDAFETLNQDNIRVRLRSFIEYLENFIGGVGRLTESDELDPGATKSQSEQCHFSFLELSRASASEFSSGAQTHGLSCSIVDPREYFFLTGDEGTARIVLAVLANGDVFFPDWDDDEMSSDATRARRLLQETLADDLSVFLEIGYPYQIEISDPRTFIGN